MLQKFLLTGATGFLGNTLAWLLQERGYACKALVMPGDPWVHTLPSGTEVCYGDITVAAEVDRFMEGADNGVCLLHSAGVVSIGSKKDPALHRVNVEGTRNILQCAGRHTGIRMVYVSSVHAIPEKPRGEVITEPAVFDAKRVKGGYARSKAEATALVLDTYRAGLDVSVVHPSGLIGPCDWRHGQITETILAYCKGKLPAGVRGANNFVDVRDVANGILACAEHGAAGECYILSGHCASVKEILERVKNQVGGRELRYLPLPFIKMIAPLCERISLWRRERPFLTPYAAYALGSNANYSYAKAEKAFGYCPRSLQDTVTDTVRWLREAGQL